MDELIIFGDVVKDLGNGKVGGYLCRFGSADDTDLEGDYFTADTDFGIEWNEDGSAAMKSAVYFAHAMDPKLGKRKLTVKGADLRKDDVGVWVEGILAQRDEYEQAVYGMTKAKKLGWSSGTAPHLVEREEVTRTDGGKAWHIKSWPLGLDASLTPRPAEHRNAAVPLKSLKGLLSTPAIKGFLYGDSGRQLVEDMTITAAVRLHDRVYSCLYDILAYSKLPVNERKDAIKALLAEYSDVTYRVVAAILDGLSEQSPAEAAQAVKALIGRGFAGVENTAPSTKDQGQTVPAPAPVNSTSIKEQLLAEALHVDSRSLSLRTAALTTTAGASQ